MTDNPNARRSHNRKLAERLVRAGIYVFPSSGKVPLALEWQRADTSIGTDGAEDARARARQKAEDAGKAFDEETFVGCTIDVETVKRMFRKHLDAVPSISLGPSGLYVLDADIDTSRNGPELLRAYLAEQDIPIDACSITKTRSGGEHVYFKGPGLRSHVGKLMKSMYVQVKAAGNQVVAPGAWREDGKRYSELPGHPSLASTFAMDELPAVPPALMTLQTEREQSDLSVSTAPDTTTLIEQIKAAPSDLDTLLMLFDLDALKIKDVEFRNVCDEPSEDTSANRFTYLKCLYREFRNQLSGSDYIALLQSQDGMGEFVGDAAQKQGEWNYRNFVRDFTNSQSGWYVSDGNAFGSVDDDDPLALEPDEYLPPHYVASKADKAERKQNATWKLEWISDLRGEQEPIFWIIEDLIEQGTVGLIYGAPGAAKTVNMIDMTLRISHGLPWQGRIVEKMAVLYVAQEGQKGVRRRVEAWHRHIEAQEGILLDPDAAFVAVRRQIDLFTGDTDYKAIRAAVREIETRSGRKVGMIVIDTLRAALVGGDENKQVDTSIFMAALNRLCAATNATIVAVHHSGKDESKGASGSTNILGSVDWSIEVQHKQGYVGEIRARKMRDADVNQVFGFKTFGIEVGVDNRGKPQVAVVADVSPIKAEVSKKPVSAKTVREALGDVSDEDEHMGHRGVDEGHSAASVAPANARRGQDALAVALIVANDALVTPDTEGWKPLSDLIGHCPILAEIAASPNNTGRALDRRIFGGEPCVVTSIGRLQVSKLRGRKGTVLRLVTSR